ncbi:hypothetical protein J6590_055473 [Homalodisca vitripennis]|nr:hypothetical protein J6590_055473 [Homalodisca vitripennis]
MSRRIFISTVRWPRLDDIEVDIELCQMYRPPAHSALPPGDRQLCGIYLLNLSSDKITNWVFCVYNGLYLL